MHRCLNLLRLIHVVPSRWLVLCLITLAAGCVSQLDAGDDTDVHTIDIKTDRKAPTTPTGLTGTATSCSEIGLSWNASTDMGSSGLKGYNVYVGQAFDRQVTTLSTTYTSLVASTTYSYEVSAIDNAGNDS